MKHPLLIRPFALRLVLPLCPVGRKWQSMRQNTEIQYLLSADRDFGKVDGINLITSDLDVIAAAKKEGRLKTSPVRLASRFTNYVLESKLRFHNQLD